MNIFNELRRRNVFRVGIAYVIVAWLLLQVADTLGPALRLPGWFQSGVVFVLILGFPLVLIFAWAFELTPEGLKREKEVDRGQSITGETGQKLNYTIIGLLLVAVIYLGLDKFAFEHEHEEQLTTGEPSIAVLPFTNMSDDASNEFFADGITEELLNLLAKIPELQVTSRTSAFQFKGREDDIPTVAQQLNVEHVLEGSVRKSGTKVRITAQLIDAGTDRHVWSETYDRELDDIFAIQDEIAREVVDVLQVTLLGEAPTVRTTSTDAYTLYLEGQHFLERDLPSTWPKGLEAFEKALDIDPGYAPAWYGRARAMREMANFGLYDLHEGTELAREWAQRAVEIDPTLAVSWAWLAHFSLSYDWDWQVSRQLIDRALEEGPKDPRVLTEASRLHQVFGEYDKMIDYAEQALALDPLSKIELEVASNSYWYAGNWERALALYRKNEAINGADVWPGDAAQVLMMQGRFAEAAAMADSAILSGPQNEDRRTMLIAFTHAPAGREAEAEAALQWSIENMGVPFGYQFAEIYAIHGDVDKAFEWLEISYENRDGGLTYLLVDHFLAPLHEDPRWRAFLDKMNLLEYWDAMPRHPLLMPAAPAGPADSGG
ncbi:MAG: hypothetical protein P8X98_13145 [Woeseiaceae bacterium]